MVYKHLDGLLHLDGFQLFIEAQIKSKTIQVSFFLIWRCITWSLKSVQ